MPGTNPTIRRWELASRLRRHRESRGMSLEDVAAQLLCTPSKISRLETATRGASLRDVRDLCRLYDVPDADRDELMTLVREAKQPGWWQRYDELASRWGTYFALEDAASSIQQFETSLVPGLLQTGDYTNALVDRIGVSNRHHEIVQQAVLSRQERQKRLLSEDPLDYWVILDEAALHRLVGGTKVMRSQLEHVATLAEDHRVVLQIIPFSAGAHTGMEGNFTVLQFASPEIPDSVYLEHRAGGLFLNRDADLRLYRATFDHLRATAESPHESIERIQALARIIDS